MLSSSSISTTKTSIVFQPPLQGCGRSSRKDSGGCLSILPSPHCSCFSQDRISLSFLNLYYIVCAISINPCAYDRWYFTAYIVYFPKLSVNDIHPIGGGNLRNSVIGFILLLYIYLPDYATDPTELVCRDSRTNIIMQPRHLVFFAFPFHLPVDWMDTRISPYGGGIMFHLHRGNHHCTGKHYISGYYHDCMVCNRYR